MTEARLAARRTPGKRIAAELGRMRISAWLCALFLVALITVILFADPLTAHNPTEVDLSLKFHDASADYPFGCDDYGRCVFCRCIFAVRTSVGIAFTIELASVIIGLFLGMMAAYFGRLADQFFTTVSNALMSFPNIILVMLIIAFLGPSTKNIIVAMLLVDWIWYARITRSLTLSLKERKYVQAARMNGASPLIILRRHIAPGIIPQLIGQFTLALGNVILGLAGLSFLGLGVQRPTPELGIMISDGCNMIRTDFSELMWPGLILFVIVLGFNVIGELVSERLRGQR
ncbi:MAG: ABC transporter permease [Firmicutes bacterium]|nr:ABC transporter permease [Bacillota bacterium]